jgi:hypothetical protein
VVADLFKDVASLVGFISVGNSGGLGDGDLRPLGVVHCGDLFAYFRRRFAAKT